MKYLVKHFAVIDGRIFFFFFFCHLLVVKYDSFDRKPFSNSNFLFKKNRHTSSNKKRRYALWKLVHDIFSSVLFCTSKLLRLIFFFPQGPCLSQRCRMSCVTQGCLVFFFHSSNAWIIESSIILMLPARVSASHSIMFRRLRISATFESCGISRIPRLDEGRFIFSLNFRI